MQLNNLKLRGFRNYTELDADFVPGVNLILGDNAQGKTNLLEAISYLGSGRKRNCCSSALILPIWKGRSGRRNGSSSCGLCCLPAENPVSCT